MPLQASPRVRITYGYDPNEWIELADARVGDDDRSDVQGRWVEGRVTARSAGVDPESAPIGEVSVYGDLPADEPLPVRA